ncbi:MAG: sigma-70 family RNA polymerase sigma factor [Ignavibacteria bacterium]|nr:sigma-70 family RNA polymerase sigma factor [Ignavibacteria bacterium]
MSQKQDSYATDTMIDLELIQRAKQGDMGAFEQLVFRYDKQVLTIAARHVQSSEDAKDIYQEVFLRVYRSLPKFQLRSQFSTWLFRITTNVCLTHRSRRKRHIHASLSQESDDEHGGALSEAITEPSGADRRAERSDMALHVAHAMESLSSKQKMVFTLKYYDGYKIREIAEMLDLADGTVKRYLFAATRKMRHALKDLH